ncbi:MAG: hypothetical protein WCC58_01350, partial [Burkholderiales bacterium]
MNVSLQRVGISVIFYLRRVSPAVGFSYSLQDSSGGKRTMQAQVKSWHEQAVALKLDGRAFIDGKRV